MPTPQDGELNFWKSLIQLSLVERASLPVINMGRGHHLRQVKKNGVLSSGGARIFVGWVSASAEPNMNN
ncbi:hypothetical protein [Dulcicalothrix desertica]|uniref:hypothetical protein n=1 Tax=Dulcicalothrix desertica TaxID=32056 RepID=UPI000F8D7085|nr:hypothetical protein [Dulcicalothrix desertica]TWH50881.1 hypothetical protein CAL7102_05228 [Dulcicalothrix desertica PCC 7102]